jgi:hypothetical protein
MRLVMCIGVGRGTGFRKGVYIWKDTKELRSQKLWFVAWTCNISRATAVAWWDYSEIFHSLLRLCTRCLQPVLRAPIMRLWASVLPINTNQHNAPSLYANAVYRGIMRLLMTRC